MVAEKAIAALWQANDSIKRIEKSQLSWIKE